MKKPNRRLQAMRLSITVGLAVLFLLVLLWASAGSTPAVASLSAAQEAAVLNNGSVITIGVAAALSPPLDSLSWPQANAVQLAISETNAAGGIDIGGVTHTLVLVTADSACDPMQAATAANTLLDAGAVAVVGHTCSGASFAAQPIYNAAGVPMVSPSSSRPDLTEQGYTTTFRVYPRDDAQAILLATCFHQWLGMDEAAIVEWSGHEYSTDAFSNTFTSLGGTITSRRTVTSTDDYTATLTAIQPENPDAVFYADGDANNAGLLSSIAHNVGLSVIGWDAVFSGEPALGDYATAAGTGAEGDYASLQGRRTEDMPGYDTFNAAYQAAGFPNYGDEADGFGAYAYDAARIIIAAIDRADSANPAAIRDEIAATADYDGVVGTYEGFDAKGDVIPQWAWLERYQNGQWVMVYPYRVFLPLVLKNFQ
jgi:branched-chain amino acid transport system substrate-binding protein